MYAISMQPRVRSVRRRSSPGVLAVIVCLLGTLLLETGTPLSAREWTTRDGKSTVQADLIDADADNVILKRDSDGKLFRVPRSRLSLGDLQYVQEAMQAAGKSIPLTRHDGAEESSPGKSSSATAKSSSEGAGPPPSNRRRSGPPLADDRKTGWQVHPDPPAESWTPRRDDELRIPIPSRFASQDDCVFPLSGSPFVALGTNQQGQGRELWDLRKRERVGLIRDDIPGINKMALSPDGRHLAVFTPSSRGKIDIWSFARGKLVRQIELGQAFSSVYGLDFAGPDQLVAALPIEKGFQVWDVGNGNALAKVETYPVPMSDSYAISPGGSYLALFQTNRIQFFDLRNGALAGDVTIPAPASGAITGVTGMAFAADGDEFAVLAGRHPRLELLCWSLQQGRLLSRHALNDQMPRSYASSSPARVPVIEWIGERGWLVLGAAVVDREKGGPIWVAEDRPGGQRVQRRLADDERMLVAHGDHTGRYLEIRPIPWDEISEGQRKVTAGGTVADVGLPDVTTADWSKVRAGSLVVSRNAVYEPQAQPEWKGVGGKVHFDSRGRSVKRVLISGPEVATVLISGDATATTAYQAEIALAAGMRADTFDLRTGEHQDQFELPFPCEIIDYGPAGERGLYRDLKQKDRLDLFHLPSSKHLLALRPYQGRGEAFQRQVKWAALVDDSGLLTLSQGGRLVRWSLPDCRAEWELEVGPFSGFLDASRRYFAVGSAGEVLVIDARTGQACRRLVLPPLMQPTAVTAIRWQSTGERLAALLYGTETTRLLAWDVEPSKLICNLQLPFQTLQLHWADRAHVALESLQPTSSGTQQLTLVDVDSELVVWRYQRPLSSQIAAAPKDSLWCLMPTSTASRTLAEFQLPDSKAADVIRSTAPPEPLFGKGKRVALQLELGGMPAELTDRRRREDDLRRELEEFFEEQLRSRGVTVSKKADVTLTVAIKNLTQEDLVELSDRYANSTVLLSFKTVYAQLSIDAGRDLPLWHGEHFINTENLNDARRPRDMPLSVFLQVRQWEEAKRWLVAQQLPRKLYHPDMYLGLGESELTAQGIRFLNRVPQR